MELFFSPVNSLHCKRPLGAAEIGANGKSEKKIKKEQKQKKCLAKPKGTHIILIKLHYKKVVQAKMCMHT